MNNLDESLKFYCNKLWRYSAQARLPRRRVHPRLRRLRYRLLEKAGIVKLAKAPRGAELISVTPGGERLVSAISGFKKWKEADGTFTYQVPLAQRQLVNVSAINMIGVNNATVEYSWKWVPNQMGDLFDAGGPLVKGFNLWDRQTLINKYEADFYHATPTKSTLTLSRTDQGWKIAAQ